MTDLERWNAEIANRRAQALERMAAALDAALVKLAPIHDQPEVACNLLAAVAARCMAQARSELGTTKFEGLVAAALASAVDVASGIPGSRVEVRIVKGLGSLS